MKALKTSLAVLGLSLALFGVAGAQGRHGHEGGGGDRGGRGGGYSAPRNAGREEAPRGYPGGGGGYRGGGYRDESRPAYRPPEASFAPRGYARPDYPGYAPGYAPVAPRGSWRRGDFLPRSYLASPAVDPRRYRLRSPPPGYVWYGVGRDAYLVQRSTGLILDTAPGAW